MMTEEQKRLIERITAFKSYFAANARPDMLWTRELDISNEISDLITNKPELLKEDFQKIATVFNKIQDHEHYDGSGWFDYKLRLGSLFYVFGYNLRWDSSNKLIEEFDNCK